MLKSGYAQNIYVDRGMRNVSMKQGVLGIKISIQLPHDPSCEEGVSRMLPDIVEVSMA